jgi:hypothetical protein
MSDGEPVPIVTDLRAILALSDRALLNWREEARGILQERPDPLLTALYRTTNDEICVRAEKAWATAISGDQGE